LGASRCEPHVRVNIGVVDVDGLGGYGFLGSPRSSRKNAVCPVHGRARQNPGGRRHLRRIVLTLASIVCCLFAAGCDKCSDPVKFNLPGLPKACYDSPRQK
jgi:hypothetical protein